MNFVIEHFKIKNMWLNPPFVNIYLYQLVVFYLKAIIRLINEKLHITIIALNVFPFQNTNTSAAKMSLLLSFISQIEQMCQWHPVFLRLKIL